MTSTCLTPINRSMARLAKDSVAQDDIKVTIFNPTNITELADSDELYNAFESGWPVVISGLTIPGIDYDYYDKLPDWVIKDNKWIAPWYPSDVRKRDRLRNERDWSEEQIDEFAQKHRESNTAWNNFFAELMPRYANATGKSVSHRYNMLVENNLHFDELDEEHTGQEQQIRVLTNMDKQRCRITAVGPNIEQLYNTYYDEFKLWELDKEDPHTFITEMRNRCVWNDRNWSHFHHPLHYITCDPGDIWLLNAQWVSHQIVFGAKLQVFEADIQKEQMLNPELVMAERIKNL